MEELLAKYFSGEATQDERLLVDSWKSESEDNASAFFESKIVWSESVTSTENYDGILASILDETPEEEPALKKNIQYYLVNANWPTYAAAAVLVLAIGLLFVLNQPAASFEVQDLADGSEISIHGNSQVEVLAMNEQVREVKLTGKAYFDIERDETRPFIIYTENATVTVLGTSFLINADELDTEVCVESGVVELSKDKEDLSVRLERGEMGLVTNSNKGIIKKANDDPNYLAWKTKVLTFKETKLPEVVNVLEDVYGISVQLDNANLQNCKLTAKISKKKAKDAVKIIAQTFNLAYTIEGKEVTLSGKGC